MLSGRPRRPHGTPTRIRHAALTGLAVAGLVLAGCSNSTAGKPSVATSSTAVPGPATSSSPPSGTASVPSLSASASGPPASGSGGPASASSPPSTTAPPTRATVIVTYSGYDRASGTASAAALVPSVLVPSASCTLVLSHDGVTYRVAKRAAATANSMQCGTIEKAGLAPGGWTGTVEFSSPTVRGTSAPFTIQVTA